MPTSGKLTEQQYIYIVESLSGSQITKHEPYYFTEAGARNKLAEVKADIGYRVHFDVDTPDRFEFLIGWEEHHVVWRIVKKPVI